MVCKENRFIKDFWVANPSPSETCDCYGYEHAAPEGQKHCPKFSISLLGCSCSKPFSIVLAVFKAGSRIAFLDLFWPQPTIEIHFKPWTHICEYMHICL